VPLYSLDSKIMDTLCSHHSQEKIGSGTLPASNTLAVESPKFPPSSSVEPQSILTSLVPALLNTDSATSMMMVVDPTSVAPTTATTRGPCQDNVPDTSDPLCIDLLGGEHLPSQLNCFSADQESKKFYPLDSAHQDFMDLPFPSSPLENVDTSELPMSNAMAKSTMPQVPDFRDVTQALSGHSTADLLHAGSARVTLGDDIWTNPQPPPLVAPSAAPAVPDRPLAAPDPVTGVTLPTTAAPYDCTTLQLDCTLDSEMPLSHHPDGDVHSAPITDDCITTPGHVTPTVSTIVTQHYCAEENPTLTSICIGHWQPLLIKGCPRTTSHRNLHVMFSGIPIHKKVHGMILMEIARSFMENGERIPFVLIWLFLIITVYCCILLWLESLLLHNVPLTSQWSHP